MTGIECRSICEGVEFLGVQDPKFKTARMSVHFLLPMREEEASANALLPFLLSRASRAYPDYTKLGQLTAQMAVQVLQGEDPATMPVQVMDDGIVTVNTTTARELGIDTNVFDLSGEGYVSVE